MDILDHQPSQRDLETIREEHRKPIRKRSAPLKRFRIWLIAFLLLGGAVCFPVSASADTPEPSRVLVLHSYHQGFSWTDALQRGFEETFEAAPMEIELSVEYLDTKRHPGRLLFDHLAHVYAAKYQRWRPDLILSCDDDALAFLFQYRNTLFPGVPVVFCGLNVEDYDPAILDDRVGYTGVVERLDLAATIDLILKMQPNATRIAFIHDRTTSGIADRQTIAALAPRYADRITFIYPDNGRNPDLGISEAELLSFLRNLPPDSAAYFLGFFRDRFDTPLALDTIIPRISEASPVPVYSHAEAFLGYGILGGKLLCAEIHGRSTAEKALRLLAGVINQQITTTVAYRIRNKQGHFIWVETTGKTIRNPQTDEIEEIIAVTRDITERKLAQEERLRMEKHLQKVQRLESLGVLAGGIAHDFNNILMTMLGNIELVKDTVSGDSTARNQLEETLNAGQRAAALIRQMLAFSGKGHFIVKPVDLNRLIESIFELIQAAVPGRVSLDLRLERPLAKIEADESQIRQILMNLILNAAESYEPDTEGAVTLSTGVADCDSACLSNTESDIWLAYQRPFTAGRFVFLEVEDAGPGLDPETRKRLFEPFYSTKFQGRGLGLAAVLGIVRGHKGFVRIDSEPGGGTAVRVLFPALPETKIAEEPRPKPPTPALAPTGKEVILLVDDEEPVRAMIRQMLERMGYSVISAGGGPEAVEIFREKAVEIDLVLCDLKMDDMSGLEVLHQLRRINRAVRVILSSGYSEAELKSRYGEEGFAGFLQKPYRMQTLKTALENVLGKNDPTDIRS
ncbi:MAG: response regulator [Thermodesulfobacteriota bacterium]